MHVWEIVDKGRLSDCDIFWKSSVPRLYVSREAAEAVALPLAQKAHDAHVEWGRFEIGEHYDHENYLTINKTDDQTYYGCKAHVPGTLGQRETDYGWVRRRSVVEEKQ